MPLRLRPKIELAAGGSTSYVVPRLFPSDVDEAASGSPMCKDTVIAPLIGTPWLVQPA